MMRYHDITLQAFSHARSRRQRLRNVGKPNGDRCFLDASPHIPTTRLTSPMHGNTHVICVYSRDWRNEAGAGFCDQKVTKQNTKFFCDLWMIAYDCQLVDLRSQRVL
jgi:hypothetical protein